MKQGKPRRARRTDLARAKQKAKDAWSLAVRERAGNRCERCGAGPTGLHAHHVIPSTWERYRFDLDNGVSLCYRHHIHWAHKDAPEFLLWLYRRRPHLIGYYKQERLTLDQNRTAYDYEQIVAGLREALELEQAA